MTKTSRLQDKAELVGFLFTCDELASRIIQEFEKGKFVVPSFCGLEYRNSDVDFVFPQKLNHVKFTVSSKCFNLVVKACKYTAFSIPWALLSSDSLVGDIVYGGFSIQAIARSFFGKCFTPCLPPSPLLVSSRRNNSLLNSTIYNYREHFNPCVPHSSIFGRKKMVCD